jgi:hypothetical protein
VFATASSGLHAKDICRALGVGTTANHTESLRATRRRLVARGVLTEPEPGMVTLAEPATSSSDPEPTAKRT